MKHKYYSSFIAIVVMVTMLSLFIFVGCDTGREYHDDIHIQLENHKAEIIIKEWQYLLGSGAEVYYKNDGKEILLGKISGGDDGFCPFKEGLYQLTQVDDAVTIKWAFRSSDDQKNWRSETFNLPLLISKVNATVASIVTLQDEVLNNRQKLDKYFTYMI